MKLHLIVVAAATLALCNLSQAEPGAYTGNTLLPACKALAAGDYNNRSLSVQMGMCAGTINAAFTLLEPPVTCIPGTVTLGQAIRVTTKYLEDNPSELHQELIYLSNNALIKAWPCKQ